MIGAAESCFAWQLFRTILPKTREWKHYGAGTQQVACRRWGIPTGFARVQCVPCFPCSVHRSTLWWCQNIFFESSGVCWAARASSKAEQRQIMNHEWSWLESPEIHQVASRYQGLWHIMGAMEVWSGMIRYGPVWPGMARYGSMGGVFAALRVAGGGLMVKKLTQHAGAIAFHNCSSEDHGAEPQTAEQSGRSLDAKPWSDPPGKRGIALELGPKGERMRVFHATPAMISIILYQVSVSKELTANHSKFRLQLLTEVHSNLAVESLSSCQWRKWHRMILTVTCTNLTDFLWQLCILILIPGRWLVTTSRCSLA